jgi:hypothetical protein
VAQHDLISRVRTRTQPQAPLAASRATASVVSAAALRVAMAANYVPRYTKYGRVVAGLLAVGHALRWCEVVQALLATGRFEELVAGIRLRLRLVSRKNCLRWHAVLRRALRNAAKPSCGPLVPAGVHERRSL